MPLTLTVDLIWGVGVGVRGGLRVIQHGTSMTIPRPDLSFKIFLALMERQSPFSVPGAFFKLQLGTRPCCGLTICPDSDGARPPIAVRNEQKKPGCLFFRNNCALMLFRLVRDRDTHNTTWYWQYVLVLPSILNLNSGCPSVPRRRTFPPPSRRCAAPSSRVEREVISGSINEIQG